MNRSFHSDCWPAWLEEVERRWGRTVTDAEQLDDLYASYLLDEDPAVALASMEVGLLPVAIPLRRVVGSLRQVYATPRMRYPKPRSRVIEDTVIVLSIAVFAWALAMLVMHS